MRLVAILLIALLRSIALAAPITFDLHAPTIKDIDDVNSFSLTMDRLTAMLTGLPHSFNGNELQLNQTSLAFGVNVDGTTCGGLEDSDPRVRRANDRGF